MSRRKASEPTDAIERAVKATRRMARDGELPVPRAAEQDIISLLDEARYAEDTDDRVRAAAQIIRQHSTLVEQRERLVEALRDLIHQLPTDERLADFNLDLAESALATIEPGGGS